MLLNIIHSSKHLCHSCLNQSTNLAYQTLLSYLYLHLKNEILFLSTTDWVLYVQKIHVSLYLLFSQLHWSSLHSWRHCVLSCTGFVCPLPGMPHFLTFTLSAAAHLWTSTQTSLPFKRSQLSRVVVSVP